MTDEARKQMAVKKEAYEVASGAIARAVSLGSYSDAVVNELLRMASTMTVAAQALEETLRP